MNIENVTPDNNPDKNKSSSEIQENFVRNEIKLIDEFNSVNKEYTLDPNTIKLETKKV
jgi:hypothetical protein